MLSRFLNFLKAIFVKSNLPPHLKSGKYGENAAKKFLKSKGLKFLTSNYNSGRGEIDLIFRDGDCLVFVEVKTRDTSSWTRPEKAVDFRKRKALSRAAWDYIRLLKNPRLKFRFDIVEVITRNQQVQEIRHIENAFNVKMIL